MNRSLSSLGRRVGVGLTAALATASVALTTVPAQAASGSWTSSNPFELYSASGPSFTPVVSPEKSSDLETIEAETGGNRLYVRAQLGDLFGGAADGARTAVQGVTLETRTSLGTAVADLRFSTVGHDFRAESTYGTRCVDADVTFSGSGDWVLFSIPSKCVGTGAGKVAVTSFHDARNGSTSERRYRERSGGRDFTF